MSRPVYLSQPVEEPLQLMAEYLDRLARDAEPRSATTPAEQRPLGPADDEYWQGVL